MNIRKILSQAVILTSLLTTVTLGWYIRKNSNPVTPQPPAIVQPQRPQQPIIDPLTSIRAAELQRDVYYLASQELEGRMIGQKGNVLATNFLQNRFQTLGMKVVLQEFYYSARGGNLKAANVIAWIAGSDPVLTNEIVVVGAHFDHIGRSSGLSMARMDRVHPGADDNASGTAAVLAVAKAFASNPNRPQRTVCFQLYNGEELGMKGSQFYCEHPLLPEQRPSIRQHVAMVNLDMVGYLNAQKYTSHEEGPFSSIDIQSLIRELSVKYSFAAQITNHSRGASDHAPFHNKGIPTAYLFTGMHRNYHTPNDTPEKLDYAGLEQISKYCYDLVYRIAQLKTSPTMRTKSFTPIPYDADQGSEVMFIKE